MKQLAWLPLSLLAGCHLLFPHTPSPPTGGDAAPRDAAAEPRDRAALDGPPDETRPDTVARVDAVLAPDGLQPDTLKPDAAVPLPPPVCAGRLCWQNPRPVGVKLNGVWGTGPNNVYVVGAGIVLRWDGTSWSAQDLGPNSKGETFWAISGCSANDIYVLGSHLYRFDGSSWKQVDPLGGFFYHDLVCAGPKAVVAVGQAGQVKRFDGTQWIAENAGTSTDLLGVWGAGPLEIGAVGEDGSVLGFDGAWKTVRTGNNLDHFDDIWGSSVSEIYITGRKVSSGTPLLYHSTDGTTWVQQPAPVALRRLWGSSASDRYALSENAVYRFESGSWLLKHSSPAPLNAIWGSGPKDIWVVGDGGMILRFNGSTWLELRKAVTTETLRALWRPSATLGYAVGDHGTVLRWDGATWTSLPKQTSNTLRAVWGASASAVFVAGDGTILRYDGASQWKPDAVAVGTVIHGLFGTGAKEVFAVGSGPPSGVPLVTPPLVLRHGGVAWDPMGFPALSTPYATVVLKGVWGTGASNLYAAGGGYVYRNNGATWVKELDQGALSFNALWGSGVSDVFAVGAQLFGQTSTFHFVGNTWNAHTSSGPLVSIWGDGAGLVLALGGSAIHRFDGANWLLHEPATGLSLQAIAGSSAGDIVAVGAGGAIVTVKYP